MKDSNSSITSLYLEVKNWLRIYCLVTTLDNIWHLSCVQPVGSFIVSQQNYHSVFYIWLLTFSLSFPLFLHHKFPLLNIHCSHPHSQFPVLIHKSLGMWLLCSHPHSQFPVLIHKSLGMWLPQFYCLLSTDTQASNSSSYVQDAFQLLCPVLQLTTVQQSTKDPLL